MQNSRILAVVDNVIRLKRDTLGPVLLSTIRNELTRENPAYHQMKSMASRNPQKYRHTTLPASTITSIEENDETIFLPRGYKLRLLQLVKEHGCEIKMHDRTLSYSMIENARLVDSLHLKDYQKRGLSNMVLSAGGVLVAPCGGGKTVTGIAILTTIRQPTLVLVHTNDLLNQWKDELASKAVLPCKVGQWGGGKKVREAVTVGTIQTLVRMPVPELREFLDHFGCVILDEAHHCPADTFLQIMNMSKARYRYGLTATPNRRDGLEFLMNDTIGPIVAEITDTDLGAEGRSQSCEYVQIHTNFYTRYTADEWVFLIRELVEDTDRNEQIIQQVIQDWVDGQFPLVLSERVGHCHEIAAKLRDNGMNAQVLVGSVDKKVRLQIINYAKEGKVDAIVATKVADEGLDIPQLSSIHLTCPTANRGKLEQRIGRIRRPIEGKKSIIYDYVDMRVPACARMAKTRNNFYKKWGFVYKKREEKS